ncbi:MAG TPA: hypothetical protein PLS90_16230, partial [Candidatus Sumerlaeota bacterium]|nr:hypothetical protein [Candidatus Sumerlaeota bacterium]
AWGASGRWFKSSRPDHFFFHFSAILQFSASLTVPGSWFGTVGGEKCGSGASISVLNSLSFYM